MIWYTYYIKKWKIFQRQLLSVSTVCIICRIGLTPETPRLGDRISVKNDIGAVVVGFNTVGPAW